MTSSPVHAPKTSPEPNTKSRLRLWLRLLKLSSGIEGKLRKRLRDEHGTTLPRFDVMARCTAINGLKMTDLSDHLKVSNGNVTGILDRLTEEGLAFVWPSPGIGAPTLPASRRKAGMFSQVWRNSTKIGSMIFYRDFQQKTPKR